MKHEISFRQYRTLDLILFTSLLCICEALIVLAATRWFPAQPYTLSIVSAVTAVTLIRWGVFAAVPALAGALVFCLLSGAGAAHYLIYLLGNLAALLMLLFIRRVSWQRIRENVLLCMLFGLLTALCMQLGRALIALLCGYSAAGCAGFITTDVLSSLFSVLLCWMMRRTDGMLEDQAHYLLRIQKEKDQGKGV